MSISNRMATVLSTTRAKSWFVLHACCYYVAFVLLATAVSHLDNPYQFVASIRKYQLISPSAAEFFGILLPFLHLTLVFCLLSNWAQKPAFGLGFALFGLYTAVQTSAFARGLKITCGCFGPAGDLIGLRSIGLAAFSSLVCLIGAWLSCGDTDIGSRGRHDSSDGDRNIGTMNGVPMREPQERSE